MPLMIFMGFPLESHSTSHNITKTNQTHLEIVQIEPNRTWNLWNLGCVFESFLKTSLKILYVCLDALMLLPVMEVSSSVWWCSRTCSIQVTRIMFVVHFKCDSWNVGNQILGLSVSIATAQEQCNNYKLLDIVHDRIKEVLCH